MGLVHCHLDKLVVDSELVARKIKEHQGSLEASGNNSPATAMVPTKVLPMREAVRKSQRQKEQEEKMLQRQKEQEEQRREEERQRKRQREEARKAAQAAAAAAAAEAAESRPAKVPKLEPKSPSPSPSTSKSPLLERTLKTPLMKSPFGKNINPSPPKMGLAVAPAGGNGSPESLLMKTLLKGSSPSVKVRQEHKSTPKQHEVWSLEQPKPQEKRGSLSIKIKRTTPAKWQIKQDPSQPVKEEYTVVPMEPKEDENHQQQEQQEQQQQEHLEQQDPLEQDFPAVPEEEEEDLQQQLECEPDISEMMEISHSMGDEGISDGMGEENNGDVAVHGDEEDGGEHVVEVDPTQMLLEPQVILQDEEENDSSSSFEMHASSLQQTPPSAQSSRSKPRKFHSCPVCDKQNPTRNHVAGHFTAELLEVVQAFPDPLCCTQCQFEGETEEEVGVHVGVCHGQMEKCLKDLSLVQAKRNEIFGGNGVGSVNGAGAAGLSTVSSPTVTAIRQPPPLRLMGTPPQRKQPNFALQPASSEATSSSPFSVTCPICDQIMNKAHSRDHVSALWAQIEIQNTPS